MEKDTKMAKKALKNLALLTALAVGYNEASAQQYHQIYQLYNSLFGEDAPKAKGKGNRPANPIYGKDLTVAGNGIFLTSYVTPSRATDNGNYDLTKQFTSKDKLRYSALTAAQVKKIVDNAKVNKHVKAQVRALQKKVGKNKAINHKRFLEAIKDGRLTEWELSMLDEGTYAYLVTTGKQGVVGFYEVGKRKERNLEKEVKEILGETYAPKDTVKVDNSYAKPDSSVTDSSQGISRTPAKTLEEATIDTSMIPFPTDNLRADSTGTAKNDSSQGLPSTQFAQPIDLAVAADSATLAHGYVPADSTIKKEGVSPDTTEPFIRQTADSLLLLRDFGKLTRSQKSEWNRTVSDAIRNRGFERVAYGIYVRKSVGGEEERQTRFGAKVGATEDNEVVASVFTNYPLSGNFALEGFAEWSARKGKSYFTSSSEGVTARQLKFVDPNTQERRVEGVSTLSEESPIAEAGVALNYLAADWLEAGFGIGIQALKSLDSTTNSSTVSLERNMQTIRGPETIFDYGERTSTKAYPTLRTNLRLNPWSGLTLELILKRTGIKKGENHARLDLGWQF